MRADQFQRGEDVAWADGAGKVVRSRLLENCLWIYRIEANPGMPRDGIVPPAQVLAPGSALGSRPRVALSSAQAPPVYSALRPPGNPGPGRPRETGLRDSPGIACLDQEDIQEALPPGGLAP